MELVSLANPSTCAVDHIVPMQPHKLPSFNYIFAFIYLTSPSI